MDLPYISTSLVVAPSAEHSMGDFEDDLSLSPVRKSAPTKGRRAGSGGGGGGGGGSSAFDGRGGRGVAVSDATFQSRRRPSGGVDPLILDDDGGGGTSGGGPPPPPMHGRRTGGWADENSRAKTARFVTPSEAAAEKGGFGRGGGPSTDSDDNDEPLIPDLDDVKVSLFLLLLFVFTLF